MSENARTLGRMHVELFLPEQTVSTPVLLPKLVHGATIVTVQSGDEDLSACDALITQHTDLTLGIKTADCAPVCFSDGATIGIAHIGWRGLCLGLIEKMLTHFDAQNLSVYVGPFLHSFEIQKDFCYDQIRAKFGEQFFEEQDGKMVFHFGRALSSLLPPQTVSDARDTMTNLSFPSHRRDGTLDRFFTTVRFV